MVRYIYVSRYSDAIEKGVHCDSRSVSGRPLAPRPGRPHLKRDSLECFTSTDYRSRDLSSCPLRARRGRLAEPHSPVPSSNDTLPSNIAVAHTPPLSISLPALSPAKNKAIVRKPSLYPQRLALHYLPTKRRPAYHRTTQGASEGSIRGNNRERLHAPAYARCTHTSTARQPFTRGLAFRKGEARGALDVCDT